MNRKVSELPETQQISDNDVFMILQNNENKKVTIDKLLPLKRATVTLESTVNANTNYTLPFYYKVRQQQLRSLLLRHQVNKADKTTTK